jgi:hypothetical protein
MSITVKATREGLPGHRTASGYVIDGFVSFVALPSVRALHRFVRVTNPANGQSTLAQVLDVGPWNTHDDAYVFGVCRPLAEAGRKIDANGDEIAGPTNGAGIDLGGAVWKALEMTDNADVAWEFVTQP